MRLCATHIIIRAWRRAQVVDHYVKLRADYVKLRADYMKLCEIMCNSHNYLRVAASISSLQITTGILNF